MSSHESLNISLEYIDKEQEKEKYRITSGEKRRGV